MRFLSAHLTDFRNIRSAEIEFSRSFTALIGPNGQGKTNAIESLYLVAAGRPRRAGPTRARLHTQAPRT
ncbi:MAG: AAA family ATPase, partial [Deltaproteobacteria bacterium]